MGPATIGAFIPIAGFAALVLIVYFGVTRKHSENVELIKRGINPEKYNIKLPGRLGLPFGVVFLALGLGFLIAMIATGKMYHTNELGWALASLIGGIGLIIYWKMTASDRERALKIKEELLLRPGTDFAPDNKPEVSEE
ncbi:MAG: hypothetical protein FVQ81_01490 [Candidatus Glassbacteria bacterium]|nr:hypothetical protein [Candidatus Glassbacteria bacterium]